MTEYLETADDATFAHSATYSPEDNKLRLYPAYRLDAEDYAKVKAAGFKWAPKQELFVAPKWTPQREDLLLEMCGEIGDEDYSPEERAAYERQLIHECIPVAEAVLRTTDYSRHEIRPTNWHCGAAWCQVFARDECMGQDHSVAWISKSHEKAAKDAAAISTNRKKQQ